MTEAPGYAVRTPDSLLRGPVSTALTLPSPASVRPAGIVEILRLFFGVRLRCAFNVSTMDTSDLPGPARPLPLGSSSPPGPPACLGARPSECLRRHDTHMSQKRGDNT